MLLLKYVDKVHNHSTRLSQKNFIYQTVTNMGIDLSHIRIINGGLLCQMT